MYSTQNTENARGVLVSVRVVKAHLTINIAKVGKMNPRVRVDCGDQSWYSRTANSMHVHPCWGQSHTFELNELAPISITVQHKGLIFAPQDIGSCYIKAEFLNSGKKIGWWELLHQNEVCGRLLVCLLAEEEKEPVEYAKYINEIELEKEEVKFFKRQYVQKLSEAKKKIKKQREQLKQVFEKVTPLATEESEDESDSQEEKKELLQKKFRIENEISELRSEIKKLIEIRPISRVASDQNISSFEEKKTGVNLRLKTE